MIQATVDVGQSEIHLHKAILLYGSKGSGRSSPSINYASIHDVTLHNDRPMVGVGTSLTQGALVAALQDLNGRPSLDLLENHILAFNGHTLVFWVPPKKRKVWFACDEPMGKRSEVTPHPGLVFVANNQLHVYAVKGSRRPQADTEIFCAPYLNTYEKGDVCMGNVRVPDPIPAQAPAITDAFFRSVFTHTNNAYLVKYEGGVFSLWADLLDGKHQQFPESALLQGAGLPGQTLGQILAHFGGKP